MPLRPRPLHPLRRAAVVLGAAATVLVASPLPADAATPVRVMALGDSITEAKSGTKGVPSYRRLLWDKIVAGGYANVDLVGSRTGILGNATATGWDANHEGHWGWRTDEILNGRPSEAGAGRLAGWVAAARPDVVLVHLGTNDVLQGNSNASTIAELGAVVDTLRAGNPAVKVVLAKVIPSTKTTTSRAAISDLNSRIPGLAAAKTSSRSPVVVVDQNTGYDPTWNYDKVHPNKRGQGVLATRFYKLLTRKGWIG